MPRRYMLPRLHWAGILVAAMVMTASSVQNLFAQAYLRESLERLDKNEDGEIQPEEITPLARPYLERIAKARRISLERDNDIEDLQEAARVYYALRNGVSGRSVRPDWDTTVKPFGPRDDEILIPEFGLAEVKYPYTEDDVQEADRTLRNFDRDDDGYVDRREARRQRWTHRNPFESDLNQDGRLSRMELVQRYARRRLLSNDSDELIQKARRTGNGIRRRDDDDDDDDRRRNRSRWGWRRGSEYWLTSSMVGRFDVNRNGRLEANEAEKLGIPMARIDLDRDGEVTREELHVHIQEVQNSARGTAIEGLPVWFSERDKNRDGQVAMVEFATEWTEDLMEQFTLYDSNGDGLLTMDEVSGSKVAVGGSYRNEDAQVLPPRKTVISEIEVPDEYLIDDLNVQLSITHSHTSYLDAYLTGPDGQRIELFTGVGGSDDHFDQTIFDDQAGRPITKAKPPFQGSFVPEGRLKRQPGLDHYKGKSVQGVWQLIIRGSRSERFGMLHGWGLIVKPQEQ